MPEAAAKIERAEKETWSDERLAKELDLDMETTRVMRRSYESAVSIVAAASAAAGLREGVRQSVDSVLGERQIPDHEIESFVGQVCYRVSDFIFRMQQEETDWQEASDELREEP